MGNRRGFSLLPASLWLATLMLGPVTAWACPMCYGSSDSRVLDTYYLSTIMLSLLPFAIITSILLVALYVRRQALARDLTADGECASPGASR